jgi:hypothetical protein
MSHECLPTLINPNETHTHRDYLNNPGVVNRSKDNGGVTALKETEYGSITA